MKVKYQLVQSIVGMYNDETEVTRIPAGAILEMPPTDSKVGIAEGFPTTVERSWCSSMIFSKPGGSNRIGEMTDKERSKLTRLPQRSEKSAQVAAKG